VPWFHPTNLYTVGCGFLSCGVPVCVITYGPIPGGASIGYGSTAAIGFGVEEKLQIMV
jgi:hypothetical protein